MHGRVSGEHRDESRAGRLALPALAVGLYAAALVIFADLGRNGPMIRLDAWAASIWPYEGPYSYYVADMIDRIGQRQVCVPLLIIVAWVVCRRIGSMRALVISTVLTITLNFAVGVLKLASGRESPRTGGPEMFVGDNVLFPSGHAANVIFHYGLVAALLLRYTYVREWQRKLLHIGVVFLFVLMTFVSVYRHTHWLSDLIAGGLIGTSLLCVSLAADREWVPLVNWLRRLAGPTWVVAEWVIERLRPVVVGKTKPAMAKLPQPVTRELAHSARASSPPGGRGLVPTTRHPAAPGSTSVGGVVSRRKGGREDAGPDGREPEAVVRPRSSSWS
ncbi:phosphatase PAP2 family protein [Actinopolymorpha sp. B11F2]|uniref:phosphatase PAP2 family protein n=1 Tax=Actinopolymorpha sp. B11F2 TaxID=3160862 RepID=UPI0032E47B55